MTAIIKNNFRLQQAKNYAKKVSSEQDSNLYLFVGKSLPFIGQNADITPPAPVDTLEQERRIWDEMVGMKKILDSTTSLVVPRVDWELNEIYDIFDDKDIDLHNNRKFYVLTSNYDVFICLENNNNSASTVMPTKASNSAEVIKPVELQDGYVWKYVTTIRPSDAVNFLTDSWIPVRTLLEDNGSDQWIVQEDAKLNTSSVLSVKIENGGSGYFSLNKDSSRTLTRVSDTTVSFSDVAGSSSINQNYTLYVHTSNSQVELYDIISKSISNNIVTLTISGTLSNNVSGSQFEILPKIVIDSNVSDIQLKPKVSNGILTKVSVISASKNVKFANVSVLGGTTQSVCRVIISPIKGIGSDIEKDLGAYFVLLNAKLKFDEGDGDFPTTNDYRQIGLIQNVINSESTLASDLTLNPTNSLLLPLGSSLILDQKIQQGDVEAILIELKDIIHNGQSYTRASYIQTPETGYGQFDTTDNSISQTINQQTTTINIVGKIDSEVKKLEGEIIYIENRRPILRAENQVEDIKTIIEF
jgi:hypothetical protein